MDERREDPIRNLFSSENGTGRAEGLALMESMYRYRVAGYLRSWATARQVKLSSEDLKDLWQEALVSMIEKLTRQDFQYEGSLHRLLNTMAHHRAVELVRYRIRRQEVYLTDPSVVTTQRDQNSDELVEEIANCVEQMSDAIKLVLRTDVALYYQYDRWVSLKALCDQTQLSEKTVKSRRTRGRNNLRSCLEGKGYDA